MNFYIGSVSANKAPLGCSLLLLELVYLLNSFLFQRLSLIYFYLGTAFMQGQL